MRDAVLLVGRLLMVPMFVIAGASKLMGWPGVVNMVDAKGIPFPMIAGGAAVAVEVIAPLLIAIGLFTRYSALALAVFVAVATYYFHDIPDARALLTEKNIAIIGGLLILAATGPGRFALGR